LAPAFYLAEDAKLGSIRDGFEDNAVHGRGRTKGDCVGSDFKGERVWEQNRKDEEESEGREKSFHLWGFLI